MTMKLRLLPFILMPVMAVIPAIEKPFILLLTLSWSLWMVLQLLYLGNESKVNGHFAIIIYSILIPYSTII